MLKPNLKCTDNLVFGNVDPGQEVTKTMKVWNDGDSGTELDWKIDSRPSWGSWTFTPSSGDNLRPEDGQVSVTVKVVAPTTKDDFYGDIEVVNENDDSDFEYVSVSLSTRKSKDLSTTFITFLTERIQQLLPQFVYYFNLIF